MDYTIGCAKFGKKKRSTEIKKKKKPCAHWTHTSFYSPAQTPPAECPRASNARAGDNSLPDETSACSPNLRHWVGIAPSLVHNPHSCRFFLFFLFIF